MKNHIKRLSDDDFLKLLKISSSKNDFIIRNKTNLNYKSKKGSSHDYKILDERINKLNIDVNLYFKGDPLPRIKRKSLLYLLNELNHPYECSICKCHPVYNNKPLRLQIDHIDGNNENESDDNLRIICPNCHSQTDTYCAKNIKRNSLYQCIICSNQIKKNSTTKMCLKCKLENPNLLRKG